MTLICSDIGYRHLVGFRLLLPRSVAPINLSRLSAQPAVCERVMDSVDRPPMVADDGRSISKVVDYWLALRSLDRTQIIVDRGCHYSRLITQARWTGLEGGGTTLTLLDRSLPRGADRCATLIDSDATT